MNITGVPDDLHMRVKIDAAREKIRMQDWMLKAMESYLEKKGEK